jgi:hypothetical protein
MFSPAINGGAVPCSHPPDVLHNCGSLTGLPVAVTVMFDCLAFSSRTDMILLVPFCKSHGPSLWRWKNSLSIPNKLCACALQKNRCIGLFMYVCIYLVQCVQLVHHWRDEASFLHVFLAPDPGLAVRYYIAGSRSWSGGGRTSATTDVSS